MLSSAANTVGFVLALVAANVGSTGAQQTFGYCLRAQPNPGVLECAGREVLTALTAVQEADNYTIAPGFRLVRDERSVTLSSRALPSFLEQDPTDFRGMLENAGAVVGQRSLQWDLSVIQPGLCLRIGPSTESTSMLEFVMDPRHDRGDRYDEPPSAARSLAKQFVVPFLLGLKFNLITILPLFFGLIILLCKKAAFLGKLALFVTGLLGYGSAFSLGGLGGLFGGGYGGGYSGGYGGFGGGGWPVGGPVRPPFLNDVNVNVQADTAGGYYKGYGDEYRRHTDRQEKKLSAFVTSPTATATVPSSSAAQPASAGLLTDHFYDYEQKVLQQDRHAPIDFGLMAADAETPDASKAYRTFAWSTQT